MRRMLFVCSFFAAAVLMTGSALAGPAASPKPATPKKVDKCTKMKNGVMKCEYGGDDVWGGVIGPKGRFIGGGVAPIFKSLIDYRINFLPELNKTVEEL